MVPWTCHDHDTEGVLGMSLSGYFVMLLDCISVILHSMGSLNTFFSDPDEWDPSPSISYENHAGFRKMFNSSVSEGNFMALDS